MNDSLRRLLLFVALACAGCGSAPPTATINTGAGDAAVAFFLAVGRNDWPAAHGLLHDESKKTFSQAQLAQRAAAYRKNLGFPLELARVRLCEEQGDRANAHLTLSDSSQTIKNSAREAVVLRKTGDAWRVVLPAQFGVKR